MSATTRTVDRVPLYIAGIGVGLVAIAFATGGNARALAAAVAVGISLANWLTMRLLMKRLEGGSQRSQAAIMLLLVSKMGVLAAIVYVLIAVLKLDAMGLGIGFGALVGATVASALRGGDSGASTSPTELSVSASSNTLPSTSAQSREEP